jgi:hypothetical protein
MAEETTPLLVIFDIDETLIQFVNGNSRQNPDDDHTEPNKKYSNIVADAEKKKFTVIKGGCEDKTPNCMILRPGIKELFDYLKEEKKKGTIAVGLWTYSDQDYANGIADALTTKFNLGKDFFEFIYSDRDISDDIPKNLELVWNGGDTEYEGETISHDAFGDRFNNFSR